MKKKMLVKWCEKWYEKVVCVGRCEKQYETMVYGAWNSKMVCDV